MTSAPEGEASTSTATARAVHDARVAAAAARATLAALHEVRTAARLAGVRMDADRFPCISPPGQKGRDV